MSRFVKLKATKVFWNNKHYNTCISYCFSNFKEHHLLILQKTKSPHKNKNFKTNKC